MAAPPCTFHPRRVREASSLSIQAEESSQDPLPTALFFVRAALRSPYFRLLESEDYDALDKLGSRTSFNAVCLKCGPGLPRKLGQIYVTPRAFSNMVKHSKVHHSESEARAFKNWLSEQSVGFQGRNFSQLGRTRVRGLPIRKRGPKG